MIPRDGLQESLWQDTAPATTSRRAAPSNKQYDVAIVGAGITGCSTAYELAKAGLECLLIEARNIGFGTTGGTTAHLNTILDHTYPEIIQHFDEGTALQLATALGRALKRVDENVKQLGLAGIHTWKDALLFSQDKKQTSMLEEIHDATLKAGVMVSWNDALPIERTYEKVLRIAGQAQIHPLRYIIALTEEFQRMGGTLLEGCRMTGYDGGDIITIHTSAGEFKAKNIIHATHIPMGINLLHFRCAPYRSYALAARTHDNMPLQELIYDMEDPYHYYRSQQIDGRDLLIIGGEDHKTGHSEDHMEHLRRLTDHARNVFNISEVTHRWSSQYFETTDGLPYIGTLPGHGDNVQVATGFSGNGITLGVVASLAFTDRLVHGNNELTSLFDPKRVSPVAGFTDFVKENADVVGHMLSKPFLYQDLSSLNDLPLDQGKLVDLDGRKVGIYKDRNGDAHVIDPVCPHAKCTVKWNDAERTWDCPCHGSRFNMDGSLLTGPSTHDLRRMEPPSEK